MMKRLMGIALPSQPRPRALLIRGKASASAIATPVPNMRRSRPAPLAVYHHPGVGRFTSVRRALPEQARGLEHEDDHEEREDADVLPLTAEVRDRQSGEKAEDEPAQRRTGDVPDPAEHRGGEGLEARVEAEREHDFVRVEPGRHR